MLETFGNPVEQFSGVTADAMITGLTSMPK